MYTSLCTPSRLKRDRVFDGVWTNLNHTRVHFLSGVSIARFPAKGWLLSVPHGLKERNVVARKVPRKSKSANETLKQGKDTTNAKSFKRAEAVFPESHSNPHLNIDRSVARHIKERKAHGDLQNRLPDGKDGKLPGSSSKVKVRSSPQILGVLNVCAKLEKCTSNTNAENSSGRIIVYGDSSCLDAWGNIGTDLCFELLLAMINYATFGQKPDLFFTGLRRIKYDFFDDTSRLPERLPLDELFKYSNTNKIAGHFAGETCSIHQNNRQGKKNPSEKKT